jgi:hypothetical protein
MVWFDSFVFAWISKVSSRQPPAASRQPPAARMMMLYEIPVSTIS